MTEKEMKALGLKTPPKGFRWAMVELDGQIDLILTVDTSTEEGKSLLQQAKAISQEPQSLNALAPSNLTCDLTSPRNMGV